MKHQIAHVQSIAARNLAKLLVEYALKSEELGGHIILLTLHVSDGEAAIPSVEGVGLALINQVEDHADLLHLGKK